MAIYDFECLECKSNYEELAEYDESGEYPNIACPKCGSKNKIKIPSRVVCNFTNPIGTDKFNSHDYRHWWNIYRQGGSVEQRKYAEEHSHVGANPYPHIDTSQDDDGPIK